MRMQMPGAGTDTPQTQCLTSRRQPNTFGDWVVRSTTSTSTQSTEPFLNEQIRGNLQQAQTLFAEAAPKLAERLINLGLDERTKGYSAVAAIAECFKILQTGVVDQQQREQIEAIKAQLTALEDGQTIDV